MRARLLIALVTTAAATAAESEARDFPPPATIKPSLVPWIERAEHHEIGTGDSHVPESLDTFADNLL